jgi:hypothetical protein
MSDTILAGAEDSGTSTSLIESEVVRVTEPWPGVLRAVMDNPPYNLQEKPRKRQRCLTGSAPLCGDPLDRFTQSFGALRVLWSFTAMLRLVACDDRACNEQGQPRAGIGRRTRSSSGYTRG